MTPLLNSQVVNISLSVLDDYLAYKKITIGLSVLLTADLNKLGFDEVDWGTLIGEIQCDTMMMFDWNKQFADLTSVSDIIDNLRPTTFDDYNTLYHTMVGMWPEAQMRHIVEQSFETLWP